LDCDSKIVEGLFELLLFSFHPLDETLAGLLKYLSLLLNHSATRELKVKVIKDAVHVHALLDVILQLSDGHRDLTDVLLGLSELLDILGWAADALVDLIELRREGIVHVLGLLGDQLDLLFDDVGVLSHIHVADVLAVDLEDGDVDGLGDLVTDALFFLAMLVDVILEALSCDGVVTLIKLLDIAIGVKLVLTLELVERLNIVVEWLNRFLERLADLVEGVPKPDVLIWEELFVVGVFRLALWLISRTEGSLEHLLSVSLEQVSQKDRLQLGDLLKALDTLVKDLKNLAYDVAGLN
jgi:hypothetical protein